MYILLYQEGQQQNFTSSLQRYLLILGIIVKKTRLIINYYYQLSKIKFRNLDQTLEYIVKHLKLNIWSMQCNSAVQKTQLDDFVLYTMNQFKHHYSLYQSSLTHLLQYKFSMYRCQTEFSPAETNSFYPANILNVEIL